MKHSTSLHLLIIGLNWPEPNSSAAGARMMQLISLFRKNGWRISFVTPARKNSYSEDLGVLGIDERRIQTNDSRTDGIFKKMAPDVVIFDRFIMEEQFGWRIAEECPEALRILDTEDLHFLRKARGEAVKKKKEFKSADLYSEIAKREVAAILRCDAALLISEFERKLLIDNFDLAEEHLIYLPFLLDKLPEEEILKQPEFSQREHFFFIGNYLHPPNADAAIFLKKRIWPEIRKKIKSAEIHLYGAYITQQIQELNDPKTGFIVKGRANNLDQTFQQYRVLLAPLLFGAGLKGKFIDAMRNGTPAVTTGIGAEGICGDFPFNGRISEFDEIANDAVDLYTDHQVWLKAQKNGYLLLEKRFDAFFFGKKFMSELKKRRMNLIKNRQKNFVGQMLLHHRLGSTKYLSRWITLKNQLHSNQ